MTPVDIDKLKELLATATQPPWAVTEGKGSIRGARIYRHDDGSTSALYTRVAFGNDGSATQRDADFALIVAAVNSLAALIAKAERVDAMEGVALSALALLNNINEFGAVTDSEFYDAVDAQIRNALSPKPEDAAS